MGRDYGKFDKDYSDLRRRYGKKEIVKTRYEGHVPSKKESPFEYLDNFGRPHKRIPTMPIPASTWRAVLREAGVAISRRNKGRNLMQLTRDTVLPSLGIVAGLFLLSGNMTGSAIANLSSTDANLAGAFAVVIGIIGLLVSRKK